MDLLQILNFVKGAVSSKDFVPALTHFHIADNTIKSFNGNISLCSPIDLDIEASPKAVPFVKAIQACKQTTAIHMTAAGRLGIKSGKFKAFIPCTEEVFPDMVPSGQRLALDGKFLPALKLLQPYIAEDASRPWARGILFRGGSALATNNICVVEYWLGYDFPIEVNVPQAAVKELLRIGEEPEYIQMDDTSITFHYGENKWLRSNLLATDWPDVSGLLNQESSPKAIPSGFFDAVEELAPFVDELGRLFLQPDSISTTTADGDGASIEVPVEVDTGCFHNKQLLGLRAIAETADFSKYPAPCPFFGDNVRGVIVGMKI
jgi:DNA polymerase III sliding clamp (beta) subunit (PCNA family)